MRVMLQHCGTVSDADHRSSTRTHTRIERCFVRAVQRARGFVKNQQSRASHEHARKSKTLLFSDRQNFLPIAHCAESTHAICELRQVYVVKYLKQ